MKRLLSVILILLLLSSCAPNSFSVKQIRDLKPHFDETDNFYRFYSDFVDAFIPSEDYGKVYPFIGATCDMGSYAGTLYLYGLCTADGGIVCDPVYRYHSSFHLGDHLFYVMILSEITPSPESAYAHLGQERFVLIRDDGRYCRILDGTPDIMVNGNYLQLQIGTLDFQFLDTQLEFYAGYVQAKWNDYPHQDYYDICPCCGSLAKLDSVARIYGQDDSYAYLHDYHLNNQVSFISLDGKLIETIPYPGVSLFYASLTSDFVFGQYQQESSESYNSTAFIYDRDTRQFANIPEASGIDWLYDDVFLLHRYEEDKTYSTLIDLSEQTEAVYDMIRHGGDALLFTIDGNVSRTLLDGKEIISLRLLVD